MEPATPIPAFADLSEAVQLDLAGRGFDESWMREHDRLEWLGILNVYAALRSHGVWSFVARDAGSGLGTLNFECSDPAGLRRALGDAGFTAPGSGGSRWASRERVRIASLHFKHFRGWPANRVQAHIDATGTWLPWPWWLFPPIQIAHALRHWIDYRSYRDVRRIRRLLKRRGIDVLDSTPALPLSA